MNGRYVRDNYTADRTDIDYKGRYWGAVLFAVEVRLDYWPNSPVLTWLMRGLSDDGIMAHLSEAGGDQHSDLNSNDVHELIEIVTDALWSANPYDRASLKLAAYRGDLTVTVSLLNVEPYQR